MPVRPMRLSSRLLLPLITVVAVVMGAYGIWAVAQRERTLTEESRRETSAYATALELAIEAGFRDSLATDMQGIIDRISRERTVYGVIVYGPGADVLYASNPLRSAAVAPSEVVERVLATGVPASAQREIGDQRVYSVVRAVLGPDNQPVGAFEVAQPLVFLEAEISRTRQRFILNTLTLIAAVTVLILWLVRQLVSRPLGAFAQAAQALGRGDLGHRIEVGGGAELAELGGALNRMAGQLQAAHAELVRESDERLSLERRLRETEKLAAIGNLAASLAHEIAAPLHVIRGRAELLSRKGPAGDAEARNLRIIREQIDRITLIVHNLLDFARRREPRIGQLDAGTVLGSVLEFLEPEIRRSGVTLEWLGERTLPVRADADLLNQVFTNILINAIQALAAAETRRITVRTGTDGADLGLLDGGDCVRIDIEDTGPGVPADILARIFEPFVTTKPAGGGTGLGLAIVRSIVEEHGGRVIAENRVEAGSEAIAGSRFRVVLPLNDGRERPNA